MNDINTNVLALIRSLINNKSAWVRNSLKGMIHNDTSRVNGDDRPYIVVGNEYITYAAGGIEITLHHSDIQDIHVDTWGSERQYTTIVIVYGPNLSFSYTVDCGN